MLSWKLWRAMCAAPRRHPLLLVALALRPPPHRRVRLLALVALAILCPITYTAALYWPTVYPVLFAAGSPPALYLITLAGITACLLAVTIGISMRLAAVREHGMYDLLATAPGGGFVALWEISMIGMHHSSVFRWFRFGLNLVAFTLIVGLAAEILLPLVVIVRSGTAAFYPVLLDVAAGWLLAVVFYLDTVQSFTLASLLGMIGPFHAVSVPGAGLWSAGVFLLAQTGAYIAALAGGSVISRTLESTILEIGALAWVVGVLLGLRQLTIRYVWHSLRLHTAAGPDDLRCGLQSDCTPDFK
jgi:hypothetical protein